MGKEEPASLLIISNFRWFLKGALSEASLGRTDRGLTAEELAK